MEIEPTHVTVTGFPESGSAKHSIEQVLCWAALLATKIIPYESEIPQAQEYFEKLGGCHKCALVEVCAACRLDKE